MPRVHGNFAFTLEVPNLPDQCEGVYYALGQITLKRARSPPSAHREEPVPERARRLLVRADNAAGEPGEPAAEGPIIVDESQIQQGGMMGESAEAEQEEPSQPRQISQPGPSQPRQPSAAEALMTRFLSMPWRHRMAEAEEDGATKMAEAEEAEAEEAEMAKAQEIWATRLMEENRDALQEERIAEEAEMPEEEAEMPEMPAAEMPEMPEMPEEAEEAEMPEMPAAEMDTQTVRDSVPVAFAGAIDVEDTCSAPEPDEMTDAQKPWIPSPH